MRNLEGFRAWLGAERYAGSTIDAYVRAGRRALAFVTGRRVSSRSSLAALERASSGRVRAFLRSLPASSSSQNMARQGLAALGAFVEVETGHSPAALVGLEAVPRQPGLPRPIEAAELVRVLTAARALGGPAEVFVVLLATTGCRFSEARLARWGQFYLDGVGSSWRISGKGAGRTGARERMVPLHSATVPVLAGWRSRCGSAEWVFPAPVPWGREPVASGATVRRWFQAVCSSAGVEGVVPHQLRHTAATVMLDRCGDIRAVQEVLGHASLATTQIYTKVLPGRLRAAVESLPG